MNNLKMTYKSLNKNEIEEIAEKINDIANEIGKIDNKIKEVINKKIKEEEEKERKERKEQNEQKFQLSNCIYNVNSIKSELETIEEYLVSLKQKTQQAKDRAINAEIKIQQAQHNYLVQEAKKKDKTKMFLKSLFIGKAKQLQQPQLQQPQQPKEIQQSQQVQQKTISPTIPTYEIWLKQQILNAKGKIINVMENDKIKDYILQCTTDLESIKSKLETNKEHIVNAELNTHQAEEKAQNAEIQIQRVETEIKANSENRSNDQRYDFSYWLHSRFKTKLNPKDQPNQTDIQTQNVEPVQQFQQPNIYTENLTYANWLIQVKLNDIIKENKLFEKFYNNWINLIKDFLKDNEIYSFSWRPYLINNINNPITKLIFSTINYKIISEDKFKDYNDFKNGEMKYNEVKSSVSGNILNFINNNTVEINKWSVLYIAGFLNRYYYYNK
jgi:hypothetical protein